MLSANDTCRPMRARVVAQLFYKTALLLLGRCIQCFVKRNYDVISQVPPISFPDTSVDLTDVMSVVDPLTKVEAGLQGTGDKAIPLQSVHIKGRLLDLAAQVKMLRHFDDI